MRCAELVEQIFAISADDEGLGGRSAASLNFFPLGSEGIDDDDLAGPEIDFAAGRFNAKVAYDIPFNRGLDEGIVAGTLWFGVRF